MTGASTRCTLLSSTRISLALAQSALTSASLMYSHRRSCSICRSRSDAPAMWVVYVRVNSVGHYVPKHRALFNKIKKKIDLPLSGE